MINIKKIQPQSSKSPSKKKLIINSKNKMNLYDNNKDKYLNSDLLPDFMKTPTYTFM